ncbi:MAG TPA: DUF6541 family protein [Dermatophilaceae bacterium]|nr:DUF6541 family protein [Dermatophilaceae bacterium]
MSVPDTVIALLLAGLALYGLGVPLAWLLPAPAESQWVHRIAIGPVYAIVLATVGAWSLGAIGIPLHPLQLVGLLMVAWAIAWWRTRDQWHVRTSLRHAAGPGLMVGMAAVVWFLSLVGYGLYLPNRDFKNHAYWVAQVAWTRSSDAALIFRGSPVSAPNDAAFYPLGLHTLLGWALPGTDASSIGITAASAVLVTSVSMPLAVVALARLWDATSPALWIIAGGAGVFILGLTTDFRIGSVVLLVGASLFAAGLATLWMWVRDAELASLVALMLTIAGLFVLHVAEAVGLALVAIACLPLAIRDSLGSPFGRRQAGVAASVMAVLLVVAWASQGVIRKLFAIPGSGFRWDLQPNTEDPVTAGLVALLQQPSGFVGVTLVWLVLAFMGFWLAGTRGLSRLPLIAFCVPLALGALAGMRFTPAWLNLLTAPWYGTAARVGLMGAAPVLLGAALTLSVLVARMRGHRRTWIPWLLATVAVCILAVQVVPSRRADLKASLAGAGDTLSLARELAARMAPGETVLNLEGDGTENLFAYARVPVLSGNAPDPSLKGLGGVNLAESVLELDDPAVAQRMRELGVRYVALGRTSRYWGSGTGYAWQQVLSQPQVRQELMGTDVVVLRYVGADS